MTAAAPSRREEILDQIVDYIFERGVSDLSLRPLAEYLGTSPRMLLYHFESKDRLLLEVIAAARARQYGMMSGWLEGGASGLDLIWRYWEWAARDASRPYIRLFFEVYGLAVQGRPGTSDYLPALVEQASAFFGPRLGATNLPPEAVDELARLSVAVVRGLLFDLLATNDRAPLDAALKRYLAFLEGQINTPEGGRQ